jgi:minor extracellular serine protease Vpr
MIRVGQRACAALVVALLVIVPGAYASVSRSASTGFDSPTGAWFVELSGSAEAFNTKAKASGLQYTERFRFTRLWKGLSVDTDKDTAQLMKKLDGVVSVHPSGEISLAPIEEVNDPELAHAVAMTGADIAQNELGLDGSGVKVGVMDTGIDYHNPALGGCFGAGCRVVAGHDFVGDRFNSGGDGGALRPHPDNNPDDCNGHGTHVAGIVGANGTVNGTALKGVAPGVTFGAYKVFGCAGSTTEDIMLAAMERAFADEMDVVNMSIGDAYAWDNEPFAEGINTAVDRGMVVVISAGNSGAEGLYSLSSAGNASKVIGVASMDNSHVELPSFTVTPADLTAGYTNAAGTTVNAPTTGSLPLAKTGTPTTIDDGCVNAPAPGTMTGKAVLIRRGSSPPPAPSCGFYVKARNAQLAGASAVVLYNNAPGRFNPTVAVVAGQADGQPVTIPVVAISDTEGVAINNAIESGPQTLNWTDDVVTIPNSTAGQPSVFTSWGLTPTLNLKPDVAAPGGFIKSTYPLERGGFNTVSGTSMAAPHVSGAAALFLEEHESVTPLVLREIFQNSADPALIPGTPFAQPAHRQGAGMIDIDDAIGYTSQVSPSKLALGEGTAAVVRTLSIKNNRSTAVTYTLSHDQAAGTSANTFPAAPNQPIGLFGNFAAVTFSSSSVEVPAGETRTVDVTITPNSAAANNRRIYSGYIKLTPTGGAPLRVPYAGFTGDYQSIVVLAPGACTFPGVFKAGGSTTCAAGPPAVNLPDWTRQAAGATYNVAERPDRPIVLYHLAHQSQRVEIRAVNSSNDEFLVARTDLAERNPTNDLAPPGRTPGPGFFTFTWDGKATFTNEKNGKTNRQALPNGTYRLRLVVTKALAEAGNPAHTETWDSPTMNIVGGG